MRTLRRVLLGLLAVGALGSQFLTAPTASADTSAQDTVRIVPSQRVYGETRGELMTELWTYEYQRHVGDAVPECLSFGKDDKVLVGVDRLDLHHQARPAGHVVLERHVRHRVTAAVVRRDRGGPDPVRPGAAAPRTTST